MRKLLITLLALLPLMLQAGDAVRLRGCRQGRVSPKVLSRHQARTRAVAENNPYIGERRQMVILASFADKQFMEAEPLPVWNKIFNQDNLSEWPYYGSVRDYFIAQSGGRFLLTFDFYEVALADSCKKYHSTSTEDDNAKYFVSDIVDSLAARDIDWTPYDWDGDGLIDQLLIVYAGKGQNAGGGSNTIWPHQWWLSLHEDWKASTFTSRGVDYTVDSYCCVQEEISGDHRSFGTICHEYSHCLGLPDFYDNNTSYVGGWDLMDYGNFNGDGFCPPGYSAHERMLLGWLTPTELTEATSITAMPALGGDSPQAFLVRNDGYADEYYMIENRQPVGWDQKLPGCGVVIFHIDYDQDVWLYEVPNTSTSQHYTIFHANNGGLGRSNWPDWVYPYNQNDSLTNFSEPAAILHHQNTDGTLLMSKPITHISVDADGLASFVFEGRRSTAVSPVTWHTDAESQPAVYDLSGRYAGTSLESLPPGLYIIRCDGKTKKVVKQ